MNKPGFVSFLPVLAVLGSAQFTAAQSATAPDYEAAQSASLKPFLLGPPAADGPVVVRAGFRFHGINELDDDRETFEFSGVLTLKWQDPRQAFDPAAEGVHEKTYQGDYQFNEISPAWYPEVILVNESGMYETHGVVLRARPDGTQILVQSVNAVAKSRLNMRRHPFDRQRLEAVFQVLGFDRSEVVLQVDTATAGSSPSDVWIPQWTIERIETSTRNRPAASAGSSGIASTFVLSVDVQRKSFFMLRLVMLPLALVVLLSFSVFWMDRASLGDRISVSFIGILTAVAYQMVTSESQPRIAYATLLNGFVNLSFLTMCATVVINLVVGALDRQGKSDVGDRLDRRCRWIFPLAYAALILLAYAVTFFYLD